MSLIQKIFLLIFFQFVHCDRQVTGWFSKLKIQALPVHFQISNDLEDCGHPDQTIIYVNTRFYLIKWVQKQLNYVEWSIWSLYFWWGKKWKICSKIWDIILVDWLNFACPTFKNWILHVTKIVVKACQSQKQKHLIFYHSNLTLWNFLLKISRQKILYQGNGISCI